MWELAACVDGINRANGAEANPEPPSNDDFDLMVERHAPHLTIQ